MIEMPDEENAHDIIYDPVVDIAGGYEAVDDLDAVEETVDDMTDDILSMMKTAHLCTGGEYDIEVVSAEQQVVAGINYRVTLTVGKRENVIISYYVPLPDENGDQVPSDLELVDGGAKDSDMNDSSSSD